jgi:hypothetical protein
MPFCFQASTQAPYQQENRSPKVPFYTGIGVRELFIPTIHVELLHQLKRGLLPN